MLIDVEPLIPLLDAARKAQHDLLDSDAAWHALSLGTARPGGCVHGARCRVAESLRRRLSPGHGGAE